MMERYELSRDRIALMVDEASNEGKELPAAFAEYFAKVAGFVRLCIQVYEMRKSGKWDTLSVADKKHWNHSTYEELLPGHYEKSVVNAAYLCGTLGDEWGGLMAALAYEMRSMLTFVWEEDIEQLVIHMELFLEVYHTFIYSVSVEETLPKTEEIRDILYWFLSDYYEEAMQMQLTRQLDPTSQRAVAIIRSADLQTIDYLYEFGEYITDIELQMSEYMAKCSKEEIRRIADTYTEGYRIGFVKNKIDLSKKKTVNIRYVLGMERVVLQAMDNFRSMGLETVLYRSQTSMFFRRSNLRIGYYGGIPNKQCEFDHKEDDALLLDGNLVTRILESTRAAYESHKELARVHAGPAVIEVFGEVPFAPTTCALLPSYTQKQQRLSAELTVARASLVNEYIPGDERSFTIISFPSPAIGGQFAEIFDEVIAINTLDYQVYESIQERMIDVLDQAYAVRIRGMGRNRTDLVVALQSLRDPKKETLFENCVADVNIPVGEVFTSPQLQGTNGTLHVTRVYLDEQEYRDLELQFTDGMVTSYTCKNFEKEEDNQKYVRDQVLFHHETLPMGEFAIGTNTKAYVVGKKYGLEDRYPILIAEKTGPHFAIGDTCFSRSEDTSVYNPNGKEIIARENAISALRRTDEKKAYYGWHLDITIPYDELGSLQALYPDHTSISIIENGRFVLEGCEELNKPFDETS